MTFMLVALVLLSTTAMRAQVDLLGDMSSAAEVAGGAVGSAASSVGGAVAGVATEAERLAADQALQKTGKCEMLLKDQKEIGPTMSELLAVSFAFNCEEPSKD